MATQITWEGNAHLFILGLLRLGQMGTSTSIIIVTPTISNITSNTTSNTIKNETNSKGGVREIFRPGSNQTMGKTSKTGGFSRACQQVRPKQPYPAHHNGSESNPGEPTLTIKNHINPNQNKKKLNK